MADHILESAGLGILVIIVINKNILVKLETYLS